ncbi:DUF6541 family protein [Arthrobacter sp. B6]|uniref:DUF6541 family protein n=1 Tax=Arthrobacter sp. B6 TaxID=1570137 RepID=UPI0008367FE5|nr:DUF6541 family protein [Arthrobacter sp. B6]
MWLPVLPQILLAALLLLVPGLVVALALRFRSFDAIALAPALSVGILVITATGAPFLGVPFGVLPVGVATALFAAAGFFLGRLQPEQEPTRTSSSATARSAPFAAVTIAAVLLAWRTAQVIGAPGSISQTYDAVFHLNSVRFALDTGQASSLTIGAMTGGGFYPAGWNAVATFVASTTGADVPVAVNVTSIVLASVFWPLSCLLMTTWIAGRRSAATIAAGIACASLGAFPLLMMDFGVLYPNLLAISILPASIALAARITGAATTQGWGMPAVLALLLSLAGLVVSHPTTFMAWLVWTLPMVGFCVYKSAPRLWNDRSANRRQFNLYAAGVVGYCLVFLALWLFLRPPEEASFWGPYHTVPQALGEALFLAPMGLAPAWLVAPLALLGLWSCFRRNQSFAWAGTAFLIFSAIFVVVSGFPISPIRNFLAGVWYNDSYRVAALLPVAAVLLVAIGVNWADAKLRTGLSPRPVRRVFQRLPDPAGRLRLLRIAGIGVLSVAAVALGQQGGVQHEVALASTRYAINDDSPLVSKDELELMERLPETVPADAVLLGNPYTGAALSYAIGDRKAAQMHILSYVSPELQEIYNDLGAVDTDPDVCSAVRSANAFYVLDFGSKEVHGGSHTPAGLRHLDRNPGVQLVDSQGEATLYRITACGS